MKKLSGITVFEYKYDSEEEREKHVKLMESQGFGCTGQIRKSDDSLMDENRNYYWYAKFFKNACL